MGMYDYFSYYCLSVNFLAMGQPIKFSTYQPIIQNNSQCCKPT